MPKPVLTYGVDSPIVFEVPESGPGRTASSATAAVFDEQGLATAITATAPTITDPTNTRPALLTLTVTAAILDAEALNYRVAWTYTVAGVEYKRSQTFECRRSTLYQTLNETKLFVSYWPGLKNNIVAGGMTPRTAMDAAWNQLHGAIKALGKNPNLIKDPAPLESAHAGLTASRIVRNYAFAAQDPQATLTFADRLESDALASLSEALSNCDWYGDDLTPSSDEENVSLTRIRFSR